MSAISPDESAIDLASLGFSCTQLFDEVPCWISIQDRDHNVIKASRKLIADFGEPKDIHSLISNLITNAIDACNADQDEQKTHRVTVRAYHDKDDTVIEVEDDGVGMDSATRNALFKGMVSTKGNSGTGLGLLMSQKVATEHGGSIKVASELGKGSVFTVRLPVRQPDTTST